jgi:hypothetical protein
VGILSYCLGTSDARSWGSGWDDERQGRQCNLLAAWRRRPRCGLRQIAMGVISSWEENGETNSRVRRRFFNSAWLDGGRDRMARVFFGQGGVQTAEGTWRGSRSLGRGSRVESAGIPAGFEVPKGALSAKISTMIRCCLEGSDVN